MFTNCASRIKGYFVAKNSFVGEVTFNKVKLKMKLWEEANHVFVLLKVSIMCMMKVS